MNQLFQNDFYAERKWGFATVSPCKMRKKMQIKEYLGSCLRIYLKLRNEQNLGFRKRNNSLDELIRPHKINNLHPQVWHLLNKNDKSINQWNIKLIKLMNTDSQESDIKESCWAKGALVSDNLRQQNTIYKWQKKLFSFWRYFQFLVWYFWSSRKVIW